MTDSSDRLDRMEGLLAGTLEGLARTEKIVASNARALEAWSQRLEESIANAEATNRSTAAHTNQQLEEAITDTVQMIADLGRQQQETDQRFEVFLAEARADRQRIEELRSESSQRFETCLQEARSDRQRFDQSMAANAAEHRAFTQNIQVLLAEIARLWQRVAG